MARGLYIAFTHPRDDSVEDEFNEWYTTHHLPEILATEGVTSAVRYKSTDPEATHRYMAAYTLDGDLPEIVARIHADAGNRTPTTASRTDPGSEFRLFEFIEEQHAE
ncbi:hypothetical protein GONAM_35_00100 [Gordonia namibiensis NBRC 108229]|uniref:EthD domain-containing protein n=2 Tax=Gordonia TaxID=2053 RepID=K6XSP6_9ACTN|nr:DUF4286 family protein [Gordonia namibiensis]GAC01840.1 hypothetical protein GONAM_35_00100 [Gordonia namibiensis NBRC 108229]